MAKEISAALWDLWLGKDFRYLCFGEGRRFWLVSLFLCQVVANNRQLHSTVLAVINDYMQQQPGNITYRGSVV